MVRNFPWCIIRLGLCIWLINDFGVLRIVVIRVGVIDFVVFLIEDLELHEVEALLDEINISEVFQM